MTPDSFSSESLTGILFGSLAVLHFLVDLVVLSSPAAFLHLLEDFVLLFEDPSSCGEEEEECGGVEVLLLDNDSRDNGKIWVDIPQSRVSAGGRLLKGVGGSVTIFISSSSSSNIPISPVRKSSIKYQVQFLRLSNFASYFYLPSSMV